MSEFRIREADCLADDGSAALEGALCQAAPGDTVVVRTWPMLQLAESAAERMGKQGVILVIADKLDD